MAERFTSIRHPIAIDRGLGTLARENDYGAHVDQLIRQVLLTGPGERINRPDFGCGVRRLVFAPASDASANLLRATIVQALERWLGTLIEVEEVDVRSEEETISITVRYLLRARGEQRFLNVVAGP